MKRLFALLLAVLMLTGCQLAREEKREEPLQDKLVGVFVTFDHLDLEFDIEGWLKDNPGALKGGDVTLNSAEAAEYAGRLPVTLGEDGWIVPGYEGLSLGRLWNEEYWTTISSEGVCEMSSHLTAGDDGEKIEVNGTVYFPVGSEVMLCNNPVYMTEAGDYYVVQGQSFHSTVEAGGSMSQSVSDEKTWAENDVQTRYAAEFRTTVKGVTLSERVFLVWMSGENAELSRTEYAPGELPEAITPPADAAYLIVEEIAGGTDTRTLYQPGDESVTVYYRGDAPWCTPDIMQLHWPE